MFGGTMDLAPHEMCLLGAPQILWSLVVADLVTAFAYFAIPIALEGLLQQQSGAARARTRLVQCFVVACGVNHVMMAVTMFWGDAAYDVLALSKLVMAGISIATAAVFWRARGRMAP